MTKKERRQGLDNSEYSSGSDDDEESYQKQQVSKRDVKPVVVGVILVVVVLLVLVTVTGFAEFMVYRYRISAPWRMNMADRAAFEAEVQRVVAERMAERRAELGGGGGAGLGGLQLSPHNVRVPSLRARNRPPPSPRAAAPAADRHQREYFSDSDSDTEGQRGAGAEVFDRATHKLLSVGEAQRKQEQEVKRKRAAERAERLAMADDKERAALTSVAAKVKAQTDSTQRLVKFRSPPGMPEGVTLRDDPMTKTQAFLTQDPELL
mmetsp:Transcript_22394/g.39044  ORF Transcript_22394/g.39044 Transcript_22394/m.39044 type:complete len:264 (+) Transcript_22394:115-906(+)